MTGKTRVRMTFACILMAMILCTVWASTHQAIGDWGGLRGPDRYWTIATMLDAYCGFLTFYVWLLYKEPHWLPRIGWFVAIMLLGNMAMSVYVLYQLMRLRPDQNASDILMARNR